MKKILSFIAILSVFVGLTSMKMAIGEFKFDKETHDFGNIPFNKPVSFDFVYKNVGDAPIIINDVKPSCGCSVAEFTKSPTKPGESGKITVTYNAAAKGPFTKQFTVKSSNSKTPVKTLTVKGNVQ